MTRYLLLFLLSTVAVSYGYEGTSELVDQRHGTNNLRVPSSQVVTQQHDLNEDEDLAILKDYDFTKSLRDTHYALLAQQQHHKQPLYHKQDIKEDERHLSSSFLEICLPELSPCNLPSSSSNSSLSSTTSKCCQGGCSSTTNTCLCQQTGNVCFHKGMADLFCCSNFCGSNGRCVDPQDTSDSDSSLVESEEIDESESEEETTDESDGSNTMSSDEVDFNLDQHSTSLKMYTTDCTPDDRVCFSNDACCSKNCGTKSGRCEEAISPPPPPPPPMPPAPSPPTSQKTTNCNPQHYVCFNNGMADSSCCSNQCGSNGRCTAPGSVVVSTPNPTPKPVTPKPTSNPTSKPTIKPQVSLTPKPTPMPQQQVPQPSNSNCKAENYVCFNNGIPDMSCCSEQCGSNGRCTAPGASGKTTTSGGSTPTKHPSRAPSRKPTPQPIPSGVFSGKTIPTINPPTSTAAIQYRGGCENPTETKVTVEIQTDEWGGDVGWNLVKQSNNQVMYNLPNGTYGLFHYDKVDICVPNGMYNFTITDRYGDGICCAYGDGSLKISINNREILNVKQYGKSLSELINVGYDPTLTMTARDHMYLNAHNKRRTQWYAENNVPDVPLVWSHALAEESRLWAEELLVNCSVAGIEHEPGVPDGENLAKNTGSVNADGGGWGQLYPPDNIVGRWVEFEIERDYPGNAHLTQALWRAGKYMGCGESVKDFRNGKCRIQVCRYARAGNCDMARFEATIGRNWLPPMLEETSRCGPNCPSDFCF